MRRISDARRLGIKIAPHTCIRESIFAEPRIDHHFIYQSVLEEAIQSSKPVTLVDLGCCMGTDLRKLVLDGFPIENVCGIDIEERFFDVGQLLFNEEGNSPAIKFLQGDALDPKFSLRFTRLESKFDYVHSANVVHLFNELQQIDFIRSLAFLVRPGGVIWGRQVGLADTPSGRKFKHEDGKGTRFTINEFKQLILEATGWNGETVDYKAQLVAYDELRASAPGKRWVLQWSIRVPLDKPKLHYSRFEVSLD